ncbi:Lrp/AsnC family transcriptional regulator [Salinicola endophyticus]|uniref:Lrp/AsnC family transcriptional regulator n=1 Tax=Salinicola endophyticus TaxID=1949083 RepID=A0ABY8FLL0_9GAMM|nr:Lrp/AsnC family transcriptional regulator [Salinicola endophyticus]WFF41531.1 Lrp/AsnC family transcriptional regulator [Salinicola endophyticus]
MTSPKLDRLDVAILTELQRDGRITNAQLADRVGLSPSPCLSRVKRLQQAGYIESYHARLNLARLGPSMTLFVEITLSNHRRDSFQRFEAAMADTPEVMECHLVSGGYDYLLRMLVPRLSEFQRLMERWLAQDVGIARYFSYVVMKTPLHRAEVPLGPLTGDDNHGET